MERGSALDTKALCSWIGIYKFTEEEMPYSGVPEEMDAQMDAHTGDGKLPVVTEQNPAASIVAKCWREEYRPGEGNGRGPGFADLFRESQLT